jgi:hypothetical protein
VSASASQRFSGAHELEEGVVKKYSGFKLCLIWGSAILGSWAAVIVSAYVLYCFIGG